METKKPAFSLVRKDNPDSFFLGFKCDGSPEFGARKNAMIFDDKVTAEAQAMLLVKFGAMVQKKPVARFSNE